MFLHTPKPIPKPAFGSFLDPTDRHTVDPVEVSRFLPGTTSWNNRIGTVNL